MKIGEVIRKYRKEKQMTQEEMAEYLGVTTPAVNKWENGNSMPDISLLAPIARLLGISTDTLLSYQNELTDKEISRKIELLAEKMKTESYEDVFRWTEQQIREYPNCDKLILVAAQTLDGYRTILNVENHEKYDEKIYQLYLRVADSREYTLAMSAWISLFHYQIGKKNFEEAQRYLDRFPKIEVSAKQMRALLFAKQGKTEDAYRLYEEILYTGGMNMAQSLSGIYTLAVKENDLEKAEYITEKQGELAKTLEMGRYMEVTAGLELAVYKKDKEKTLEILTEMAHSLQHMGDFRYAPLYSHMKFKDGEMSNIFFMFKKAFENDGEFAFLQDDERYKKLLEEVKEITG